jgi:hypothetical protein
MAGSYLRIDLTTASKPYIHMQLQLPQQARSIRLLPVAHVPETRYLLKLSTFRSATDPMSSVNLLMVDSAQRAVLKRITPEFLRFQRGQTEIILYAPKLDNVEMVMMAPESGTWGLESIEIIADDGESLGRFANGEIIGGNWKHMAACMTSNAGLPRKPSEEIRKLYNAEYGLLKGAILARTVRLVGYGGAITYLAMGPEKTLAFAMGGGLALAYANMLQAEVDTFSTKAGFINSATRLTTLFLLAAAPTLAYAEQIQNDADLFVMGLIGFMMFKLSLYRSYS